MDDWSTVEVGVLARLRQAERDHSSRTLIRDELVRAVRELFPEVDEARARVRRFADGLWEITFSCVCPARYAEVPLQRDIAATQVESLTSVALVRIFGRVAVERVAAGLDPRIGHWRIRLLMTA